MIFVVVRHSLTGDIDSAEVFYSEAKAYSRAIEIKEEIIAARKMRKTVLEGNAFTDDFGKDGWDRMLASAEIDEVRWFMGAFMDTNSVCIQEWGINRFRCSCKRLGIEEHPKFITK